MTFDLQKNFDEAVDFLFEKIKSKKSFCVYLEGTLGAGKTTFVKAIMKKIYPDVEVSSPSYTIVHHYKDIYHLDLYRVKKEEELEEFNLEEMSKIFVEWPKWDVFENPILCKFTLENDNRILEIS